VLSTVEDVTSVGLVFVAILLPILVLVALLALLWGAFRLWRWRRHRYEAKVGVNARSSAAPRPAAVDPWE
jgi:hypothetical protein